MKFQKGFTLIVIIITAAIIIGSGILVANKTLRKNQSNETAIEEVTPTETITENLSPTTTSSISKAPTAKLTSTPTKKPTSTPTSTSSQSNPTQIPTSPPTSVPTSTIIFTPNSAYQYIDGLMTVKIMCGSPIDMYILDAGINTKPNGVWTYAVNPQGEKVFLAYTGPSGSNAGATVNGSIYSIRGGTQLTLETGKNYQVAIAPGEYSVLIPTLGTPISQVSFTINCN